MSESSRARYLRSIVEEIEILRSFVADHDLDSYSRDAKTRYATERALLNISEAVRNLEKHARREDPRFALPSLSPDIDWAGIKGIGNVMRHDYEAVSSAKVWEVVVDHLESLERACSEALKRDE